MKYLITLSMLLLCTLSLMAQGPDTTEVSSAARQEFLVTRLTEELKLTAQQQEAVRIIIAERSKDIKTVKKIRCKPYRKGTFIDGNVVKRTGNGSVDLTGLKPGIYIIKALINSETMITQRVIVNYE